MRLTPDDRRISEVGWSRGDLGTVVRALGDGAWVGEYFDGERRLDMILRARDWDSPEELSNVLVATPSGAAVPLGELVGVDSTVGATNLRRVDGRRTVGLNVSPPKNVSLQQAIDILKADVEPEVRKLLPADGTIKYAGNAGNLKAALSNMRENLTLAFLVLFLVMAALFRSAKDSLYVMLTIPLAKLRRCIGVVGAAAVHVPDARSTHDGRLRCADGPCREQRDSSDGRDSRRRTRGPLAPG